MLKIIMQKCVENLQTISLNNPKTIYFALQFKCLNGQNSKLFCSWIVPIHLYALWIPNVTISLDVSGHTNIFWLNYFSTSTFGYYTCNFTVHHPDMKFVLSIQSSFSLLNFTSKTQFTKLERFVAMIFIRPSTFSQLSFHFHNNAFAWKPN